MRSRVKILKRHWHSLPPVVRGGFVGTVAAGLAVATFLDEASMLPSSVPQPDLLSISLLAFAGAMAAIRRRLPVVAAVASFAANAWVSSRFYPTSIYDELIVFWIVGVASANAGRREVLVIGTLISAIALGTLADQGIFGDIELRAWPTYLLPPLAFALLPVLIGDAFRVRSELAVEAADRAAGEERLRIARDVHDVVGHHLSAIAIQAGVGEQLAGTARPGLAVRTLKAIRGLSIDALDETRALIGLVRDVPSREGAFGQAQVEALAQVAEASGLHVEISRDGSPRTLSGPVGDCAYRLLQEALTNVFRHSDARRVTVDLRYGPKELAVSIEDDGNGAGVVREGNGLTGMRERVDAVGGRLAFDSVTGTGWRVRAELPYGSRSSA